MEFVCIEAKAFMEMNEALEAVEKKMRETCGGGICSMDDWIDNQEACMLMNVSPRKLLQLRRSRIIPYSQKGTVTQGVRINRSKRFDSWWHHLEEKKTVKS